MNRPAKPAPPPILLERLDHANDQVRALWRDQERDLGRRYGDPGLTLEADFPTGIGVWVARTSDGRAVGAIAARWSTRDELQPGDLELKRLWVSPDARGLGAAKALMRAGAAAAIQAGATRIVLETGHQQPEAIGLYQLLGYHRIDNYGDWAHDPETVCMARDLPTRVLVINGTMGAGKTTTAAAIHDILTERGARAAYIDADSLCQATHAPADDPYHQGLLFDALTGAASAFRKRGIGLMVVPRVVEDAGDRDRYARAFATADAGPADVSIVRVTAAQEERFARLDAREPEGYWQEFARHRTVELEASLNALALDDAVVSTDIRDRLDVAARVLDAAGW
ncbi:GNAT family N-acetyltransferase [Demequina sp. B12]|uniref:GNAT family N-acetyltransferase n=1 Tax=Demequina sp. B12 TaxID=2992757 RepID=UPI00237BE45D|nr:GNAT family N-acetyltransferase [Demequina sp. B12]MDE0571974.1 GNAT family N-acetyltransferase [Demequina sp. B12]